MPTNTNSGKSYSVVSYPKAGYHGHRYADGRLVAVKGPHTAAEGGGGGAPAPGPSTAADMYGGPPPIDPEVEQRRIATQQSLQLGDAYDAYSKANLANTYGIGDVSNPYSKAKLLEQSYKNRQGSTRNSYAEQGQLYAGSLQKQIGEDARQNSIDYDALQRGYNSSLANIEKGRIDRYSNAGQVLDSATMNSILQALQNLR